VERQLKVLPDATIESVARACAEEDFTHVHILAHGAPNPRSAGRQFGIELHGANPGEPHVVSGEQFATALRRDGGGHGPSVVTVAACDGAHVAEVMHTGASFLYDLHRSGIPLVIGSQFPLSKEGSGDLCEKLYRGFLRGEDPRSTLADLRLRLHSRYAERNHDWASLVAYAVFPSDLEDKLKELRHLQGRRALNVAIDYMDREVRLLLEKHGFQEGGTQTKPPPPAPTPAMLEETKLVMQRLVQRVTEAATLVPMTGPFRIDGLGLIGAHKKRLAHALFRAHDYEQSLECLEECQRLYASAFDEGVRYDDSDEAVVMAPLHWALTQQLSVQLVLGLPDQPDLLATARTIALSDIDRGRGAAEVWSITTLLELDLILAWRDAGKTAQALADVRAWSGRLLRSRQNAHAVYSTRRQLLRYVEWWWGEEFARELQARRGRPTHAVTDEVKDVVWDLTKTMAEYLRANPSSVARKR
jgi:CHAT domain